MAGGSTTSKLSGQEGGPEQEQLQGRKGSFGSYHLTLISCHSRLFRGGVNKMTIDNCQMITVT